MLTYLRKTIFLTGFLCSLGFAVVMLSKTDNLELIENEEYEEKEEKERETGVDRQMEMLWQARAYPEHEFLNDRYMAAWQHAQAMRNPELISGANGANGASGNNGMNYGAWSQVGTNLNIGRVLSIAISPSNSNNVFLGSASGGIWRSTNAGSSWSYVNTGFPVLGVPTMAFHPSNGNIILAGTGEVYRVDTSNIGFNVWKARGSYGVGILRSTDGGVTWSQVFNRSFSNLFGVQMIKFDPTNANVVYACTTNGLYKSTDAGATWSASPILNRVYITDVVINSGNANQMMAAVGNLVNGDKGIYRTTDGGLNWTKVTAAAIPTSFGGFSRFVYLSGNTVYITMGRNDMNEVELFRSTDFGATWSTLANSHHCEYQFWFANTAALLPSNPSIMLMGGVNFYRYNIGTTTRSAVGSMHSDFHDIKFDPSNNAVAYIASDGGIYKTTNATATTPTFTAINNGLNIAQFYASFGVSAQNANRFVGGLQDNGIWSYNGSTWASEAGGDGGPSAVDPTNDQIAYSSNDARRVYKSTTGVTGTYSQILNSWAFVADDRTGFMAPIAVSRSNPNTLYVASDNLHKSTNGGTSWTNNSGTISANTNYIEAQFKTAIALGVAPSNPDTLYVSLSPFSQRTDNALNVVGSPTVRKSVNGGSSFTTVSGGLPNRFVLDFAISPTNKDSLMVVLGGFGTSHVYLSGNGGATWVNRGVGLPDVPFNAIVFDRNNPNFVYAACDLGVYVSNNQGQTWFDFNGGLLDATMVFDLQITADNRLVAATHGKGVFISNLATYGTLPANIVEFTGANRGSVNELRWRTSEERNVAYYEVERKVDGGSYAPAQKVPAKNQGTANYAITDAIAGSMSNGIFYYRLKTVDKDGSFTYSSVVVIRFFRSGKLEVLGNPVRPGSVAVLTLTNPQTVTLRLIDMQGRLVHTERMNAIAGYNRISMDKFRAPAAGKYILEAATLHEKFKTSVSY